MAATYKVKVYENGTVSVLTVVEWERNFGKCRRQTFRKTGEIFTQARLKAWGKKYDVPIPKELLIRLPVKVWWQDR